MRSVKWFLACVALAALTGACTSPLDEPIGRSEGALRISDEQIAGLPACDLVSGLAGGAGTDVLATSYDDLFAVSVQGTLVCVDDTAGLSSVGLARMIDTDRSGATPTDPGPAEGTPLPARTGVSTTDSNPEGTPLPAKR